MKRTETVSRELEYEFLSQNIPYSCVVCFSESIDANIKRRRGMVLMINIFSNSSRRCNW